MAVSCIRHAEYEKLHFKNHSLFKFNKEKSLRLQSLKEHYFLCSTKPKLTILSSTASGNIFYVNV